MKVSPEQASGWLSTRPPAPVMWSRGAANNEKAARFAALMLAGEWDNDKPVEPVQINVDHGFVLGGHHRLTAVTQIGRPEDLRILFWSKPKGWDQTRRENPNTTKTEWEICPECGWWAAIREKVDDHMTRVHALVITGDLPMAKKQATPRVLYGVGERTVPKLEKAPELGNRTFWAVIRNEDGKVMAEHKKQEDAEHQADALELRANR